MMGFELIVFADSVCAVAAGFKRGSHRHPQDPRLFAWWPSAGHEVVASLELARVTVTDHAGRTFYGRDNRDAVTFRQALQIARTRLRVEPMIWMEL